MKINKIHIALIIGFVILVVMTHFIALIFKYDMKSLLLDGSWDDGRTFYTIAVKGYPLDDISEYRELALYPIFISFLIPFFGVNSLLILSLCCSIINSLLIYLIVQRWYAPQKIAFYFAIIFSFARLPTFFVPYFTVGLPSMTILTSIQGSESLYLMLTLLSFYSFKKDHYIITFILIGLASITRITALLIAIGYIIETIFRKNWKYMIYIFIPVGFILAHFFYFFIHSGDFLAYFSGHDIYYPEGVITYPFHDIVRAYRGEYRHLWETLIGWTAIYIYNIVGLSILAKKSRILFLITAPKLLLFFCLNGWGLHARYFITLWAIPLSFVLLLYSKEDKIEKMYAQIPQISSLKSSRRKL